MNNNTELIDIAKQIRRDIVQMVNSAGSGHPGGSLSATDVMTALYFAVSNLNSKGGFTAKFTTSLSK